MPEPNRYIRIIERIFLSIYREGMTEVPFTREDIERAADELGVKLPRNIGDVVYSFRYRTELPNSVKSAAPGGTAWIIRPAGRGKYRFVALPHRPISPNTMLAETKVPNATPGIIEMYAQTDEQALLARLRYSRLIDVFTGVACYSLQSHLRTTVPKLGQVETDELYVGVDRRGVHFILPVQAKGGRDKLNLVQIEQDVAMCRSKFPCLVCRPIGAQFMQGDLIALFEFDPFSTPISIARESHYRLVPPENLSPDELESYRARPESP